MAGKRAQRAFCASRRSRMEVASLTIRELPAELRPRERLRMQGVTALSTAELLAVIIGSGTRRGSALHVGTSLLRHFGTVDRLARAPLEEVQTVPGMGETKAAQVAAALEL